MAKSICTYEDLSLGQQASFTKSISGDDITRFIAITGDVNPLHVDAAFAEKTFFKRPIAHGMLTGSLFSHVLGMLLPGTGAIYQSQSLSFLKPVYVGDTLQVTLEITQIDRESERVELKGTITNQEEEIVIQGISTATLLRGLTS